MHPLTLLFVMWLIGGLVLSMGLPIPNAEVVPNFFKRVLICLMIGPAWIFVILEAVWMFILEELEDLSWEEPLKSLFDSLSDWLSK